MDFQHQRTLRNRLLATLPQADLARLVPRLEPVALTFRQVLVRRGEQVSHIVFPETGWTSNVITFENGDAGEVGLIGREGMVGLPVLFGDDRGLARTIVQGGGSALRLDVATFRLFLEEIPSFRARLFRYALALQAQVAQVAACNGRHHTAQRLARWLLMAHDRAQGNAFTMTHELLAMMLGVRRAGVTVAARSLQQAGCIRYDRGIMEITDRAGLKSAACECYHVVEREFARLLGPDATA